LFTGVHTGISQVRWWGAVDVFIGRWSAESDPCSALCQTLARRSQSSSSQTDETLSGHSYSSR